MKGQRCPKKSCPCRLHDICTQNFFRTQSSRKCPLCETDWTGNDFVGERAAISTQHKPAKRKSGSGAVARGESPVAVAVEDDDEVDEAEEEDD